MTKMRIAQATVILLLIFSGSIAAIKALHIPKKEKNSPVPNLKIVYESTNSQKIKDRAAVLKNYLKKAGYNEDYCFMINMAIASGKKRFFIYNLKKDSIESSGLVAHGSGSETKKGGFVFKNTIGSLASSKGKYKIGTSYYGDYGLAYKLHGLDTTNSNAYNRFVVLHSHECVPDYEVSPQAICVSWGCPTVSPAFLKSLQQKIDKSSKPILLDIQYLK